LGSAFFLLVFVCIVFGKRDFRSKVVYGGLDAEGNVHLILKNSSRGWAELAARFLKSFEGGVVRVKVSPWRSNGHF
jgi:hypothetical protein